jgi:serine protease Do
MTKIKKTSAVLALTAASTLAILGGKTLLDDVQFARAEAKVQATSAELQSVRDLSTVFRDVGRVVEPSVVQIVVHKTIKTGGPGLQPLPNDQLKKFFKDHGMNIPDAPDDQGGGNGGNGDGGDNNDNNAPDPGMEEVGTGSGVIMETDGDTAYILTNNHVAGDAKELTVTLADGRIVKGGKTIGADAKADLAVVKIHADHLIHANWGNSDLLDRGDWVLAFGSPFGYVGSMTHGIVSALNRQAGILGNNGYENFIQVDAPINPGNSGGPLVNIHGEVIGINTAIATRSGSFSGIGFAIPVSEARPIYNMLKEKGHVTRGWLGVSIEDVQRDPGLAHSFGYDDDKGVIVQQVLAGTPSTGKLQEGDIITSIEGKPVANVQELRNEVALIQPGTTVKLSVFRDSKETDVSLTIGEQPDNVMAMGNGGPNGGKADANADTGEALGMHLSSVTDELADKFNLGDSRKGAVIISVDPRSLAGKAGLQAGDVITRVGGKSVDDAAAASAALGKVDAKKGVRLYITNAEGSRFVFLQEDSDQ